MQTDVQRFLSQVRHLIAGTEGDVTEVPSLSWNDAFSVGNSDLDQDHKHLFKLFNDLSQAMKEGKTKQAITPILDALIDYTAVHFKREEEIMATGNFPDLASHKKLHQFRSSNANTLAIETLEFVKKWLIDHIQKSDRAYAPYVRGRRAA